MIDFNQYLDSRRDELLVWLKKRVPDITASQAYTLTLMIEEDITDFRKIITGFEDALS